jgi:adenylylsulfate kinase-like enzyme
MVVWIIGLSGAGKTILAEHVVAQTRKMTSNLVLVDGDVVREIFGHDLGHTIEDRFRNAERICRLCKFLSDQGINVVCAILSLFHESQTWNRENIEHYFEIYIDAPFEQLVARDSKGLYKRALQGELKNVVGVDIEFAPPKSPDLVIRNSGTIDELLAYSSEIVAKLVGEE